MHVVNHSCMYRHAQRTHESMHICTYIQAHVQMYIHSNYKHSFCVTMNVACSNRACMPMNHAHMHVTRANESMRTRCLYMKTHPYFCICIKTRILLIMTCMHALACIHGSADLPMRISVRYTHSHAHAHSHENTVCMLLVRSNTTCG